MFIIRSRQQNILAVISDVRLS